VLQPSKYETKVGDQIGTSSTNLKIVNGGFQEITINSVDGHIGQQATYIRVVTTSPICPEFLIVSWSGRGAINIRGWETWEHSGTIVRVMQVNQLRQTPIIQSVFSFTNSILILQLLTLLQGVLYLDRTQW
jgi:hypothetical protein